MFNPFKKQPFEIDDFAKLVMTEAKKAGIGESLEYDPKSLVLKRGDQRMNLVHLFNDYTQANAEQKERFLGNALALLREKKRTFPLRRRNRKSWRPSASGLSSPSRRFGGTWKAERPNRKSHRKPISAWFTRCLVLDFPEYVTMVSPENLKAWGVSCDELFETGLAKLRNGTSPKFENRQAFTSVVGTTTTTAPAF